MTRIGRISAVAVFAAGQAAVASAQSVPTSFRDLQFLPVEAVVLESAVPVHAKSQQTAIKSIFHFVIPHNESRVQQPRANLLILRRKEAALALLLHKRDRIPLRILQLQVGLAGRILGNRFARHAVRR